MIRCRAGWPDIPMSGLRDLAPKAGHRNVRPLCSFMLAALLSAASLFAQEAQPYAPLSPLPIGTTLLSLPSPHVGPAHSWDIVFMHRFSEAVNSGSHSLLGLDGGANVTFGLSYVPARDLQLNLIRSNILDDIEASGKYVVMQQAAAIPLTLAIRAGGDFRTEKNVSDRSSYFGQAIVSRQFAERVELYAIPTFVTNAGRASAGDQSVALFDHAFNVPVAVAYEVVPNLSIVAEVIAENRDLPDSINSSFAWAVGLKRALGGHHFEIILTNSTSTTVDQYTTTSYLGGPLRSGDIHIGFNIERQFGGE